MQAAFLLPFEPCVKLLTACVNLSFYTGCPKKVSLFDLILVKNDCIYTVCFHIFCPVDSETTKTSGINVTVLGIFLITDLSKNKFSELPTELCKCFMLEKLICSHNSLRTLPDLSAMQSLSVINLR